MRELHIECLPALIPDHIEINASSLEVGQGVHVKEVEVAEGVKILDDPELMVTHVVTKMSEAKLEALLARESQQAGSAEAAAPAAVEKGKPEAAAADKGKEAKK